MKTVRKVATVVAVVANIAAIIPGPHQAVAKIVAVAATTVAAAASIAQKKPPVAGNSSQILIGSNLPSLYTMGRTYIGGAQLHDVGYGATLSGVPNPYRSFVFDWSCAGPVQEVEAFQADFTTIAFSGGEATGYYDNFMWLATQLGASPEASALAGPHGAIPGWGAAYKLSGHAAGLVTLKFDRKGKRYAAGVPQFGAIIKGVRVYDPRLDSTYPGGSGAQRFDDEATWAWSENPALHALAYARGRYQNGKKVFGCGFPRDAIDVASFVDLANVCDANDWKVGGTIYEPGSRWDNLKRILEVAAAEPVFVGAQLAVKFSAPKVAIDTLSAADLADGEYQVPAMKTWQDRKNGLIPKYRSEAHKWEPVQSTLVSVGTYVTEDGEEKEEEYPLQLCQDKDQAAQITAYKLVNGREFGPIVLPCKPRMMQFRPGEALLGGDDLEELGLAGVLMVITGRTLDPATAIVTLTLESETTAKHAFALGQTGTAPPTPSITTGEDMDDVAFELVNERTAITAIAASYTRGLSGNITQSNGELLVRQTALVTGTNATANTRVFVDHVAHAGTITKVNYWSLASGKSLKIRVFNKSGVAGVASPGDVFTQVGADTVISTGAAGLRSATVSIAVAANQYIGCYAELDSLARNNVANTDANYYSPSPSADTNTVTAGTLQTGTRFEISFEVSFTDVAVTVPAHERVYPTLSRAVDVAGQSFAVPHGATRYFAYDDEELDGVSPSWVSSASAADGYYSEDHPYRHHVAWLTAAATDGTGGSQGGSGPSGSGGWSGSGGTKIP